MGEIYSNTSVDISNKLKVYSKQGIGNLFAKKYSRYISSAGLKNTTPNDASYLGYALDSNYFGNTFVVGAFRSNFFSGKAYVYTGDSTKNQFNLAATLTGDIGFDRFGSSVSIDKEGKTIAVGGYLDNSNNGAVWIFTGEKNIWNQVAKISGDEGEDYFGWSLSINSSGDVIVVGGYRDNSNTGAAWIFNKENNSWINKLKITGDSGLDRFGISTAINSKGNIVAIGGDFDNQTLGAVWIFSGQNNQWVNVQKINRNDTRYFGYSIDLDQNGDNILIGSHDDNSGTGSAWLYKKNNNSWIYSYKFTGDDGQDSFGKNVSINALGDTIIIGGDFDKQFNNIGVEGAAWIFKKENESWNNIFKLTGDIGSDRFGAAVKTNGIGDAFLVGAYLDNNLSGAVWSYNISKSF